MPNHGDLRIWWIPQIPMKAFEVPVKNLREASLLLDVLAEYDKFQYRNHIKPDYSNMGGLEVWDGTKWIEWSDEETGDEFDEYRAKHPELLMENSHAQ